MSRSLATKAVSFQWFSGILGSSARHARNTFTAAMTDPRGTSDDLIEAIVDELRPWTFAKSDVEGAVRFRIELLTKGMQFQREFLPEFQKRDLVKKIAEAAAVLEELLPELPGHLVYKMVRDGDMEESILSPEDLHLFRQRVLHWESELQPPIQVSDTTEYPAWPEVFLHKSYDCESYVNRNCRNDGHTRTSAMANIGARR